ncbi:hypothetical protein Trco_001764 [Trichoderma cornu-damae]|uniref:Uncharacterized protein n=1 Tax=Trichoderma cornu-damae TaxID=654480 RepID=A0A9P8QSH3_9HYPO|nr:hypothetical protein Trco_001764 [Trichoderma cornu-damae]
MLGQPPSYEEAVVGGSALVVHLQVWHYTMEGRSPTANDGLAALFSDLDDWEAVPLEIDGNTGPNSHDQYVPVEVRFRHRRRAYNDPGEHPIADVRKLFFRTAPQFIYQFFIQAHSTPHNLNIFPVNVPKDYCSRYTHAYNLNPLSIRINSFFVPGPASTNDVQSWLRDAAGKSADALGILAAVVSLCLEFRRRQEQGGGIGRAGAQIGAQSARIFNVEVPEMLQELRALFQQDLYELVQDAHNATLHFSSLKQAARPLVRKLEEKYNKAIWNRRGTVAGSATFTGAVALLAILCCWNPAGWIAAGAYAVGGAAGGAMGGVTGAAVHSKLDDDGGQASCKKERIGEVDLAIKELDRCANQAREAIAMVFCAQVMQKRLDESLPEHDRRAILATLAVDVDTLFIHGYNEELICDRIRAFRENNSTLCTALNAALIDANFELATTERAA